MGIIKRGLNRVVFKSSLFKSLLKAALRKKRSRRLINRYYNKLGYDGKANFHGFFSKAFRNANTEFEDAFWNVKFNGKEISLPLKNLWLDWDQAVSILGHDITIKKTYEELIRKNNVKCFFDVGANYGTHSLLFLSQGIRSVTFEPNPNCVKVFRKLLETNNLQGTIIPNAIGDRDYETELHFPERDTWLGTLSNKIKSELENKHFDLLKVKTKVVALDSFMAENNLSPDLIKIDTEGFELQVLHGAINTIKKFKPLIIFEENEGAEERDKIFDFFANIGYSVYKLPYIDGNRQRLNKSEFLTSKEANFIAVLDSGKTL